MVAFVVWHGANLRVPGQFKGLCDCLAGTMRRGGPLAVYQGFVTSLVMFSIYRGTPPTAPPPAAARGPGPCLGLLQGYRLAGEDTQRLPFPAVPPSFEWGV